MLSLNDVVWRENYACTMNLIVIPYRIDQTICFNGKKFRQICKMVQNIRRKSFAYLNLNSNIGRNMHSWLPMKCRSLKALFEWHLLKKLFREDNKWKWQTSIYINNCLIEVKMQKCITATFYFFYLIFLIYIFIIKLNWARTRITIKHNDISNKSIPACWPVFLKPCTLVLLI